MLNQLTFCQLVVGNNIALLQNEAYRICCTKIGLNRCAIAGKGTALHIWCSNSEGVVTSWCQLSFMYTVS